MYFGFVFAAVNTLVITYYLAIERAPFLEAIFPTFPIYALIMIGVGVPLLGITGFIHFKRMPAFKSETEVHVESNPYIYKVPPGFARQVTFPHQLMMNKLILKLLTNEKITDDEIKQMKKIQKDMDHLIKGGYVGSPSKLPFGQQTKDSPEEHKE